MELFSPFFCSFLPNILTFFYLNWVTYVRFLLCAFTAHAQEESLEIIVIYAYSCRRVISGDCYRLLRTQNLGPPDRPLPSGLDSPKVWDCRGVIACAPPLLRHNTGERVCE